MDVVCLVWSWFYLTSDRAINLILRPTTWPAPMPMKLDTRVIPEPGWRKSGEDS